MCCTRIVLLSVLMAGVLLQAGLCPADTPARKDPLDPWPRVREAPNGDRLVLHQPQVDRWADQLIEARIAVELHLAGSAEVIYGALWVQGETRTNLDTRVVTVGNVKVREAKFPETGDVSQAVVLERLQSLFPSNPVDLSLDRLLANVERTSAQARVRETQLGPLEPRVIVEHAHALLIPIDGAPVLSPIPGAPLLHVVNTPWDILLESGSGLYFLRLGDGWVVSPSLDRGPWRRATKAPAGVDRIPSDHVRAGARHVALAPGAAVPIIRVVQEPAELVVITGEPRLVGIPTGDLLYVSNTSSDLFFHTGTSSWFLLASGRWFSARALGGPWHEVRDRLPADFASIPRTHPRAGVRVSVPGTPEAEALLITAQIPRRAVIRRNEAALQVTYDGPPRFQRCAGVEVSYAVNTAYDVVRVDGVHYCCYRGVWFVAASAIGPWRVCDRVPAVIYRIGPRCPVYRVTYVYVYDATPDLVVVGYLPGYFGLYLCPRRRVLVFGTGWPYSPWIHAGVWFGWPWTFGLGVGYQTFVSGYVLGVTYYTPVVRRPLRASGHPFSYGFYHQYRTTNVYAAWGRNTLHDYDVWRDRSHLQGPGDGTHGIFGTQSPARPQGTPPRPIRRPDPPRPRTSLFVGPDGNVYRRSASGWERREGTTWRAAPARPPVRAGGLDRDARGRIDGARRVEAYDRWQRQPPPRLSPPRSAAPRTRPRGVGPVPGRTAPRATPRTRPRTVPHAGAPQPSPRSRSPSAGRGGR